MGNSLSSYLNISCMIPTTLTSLSKQEENETCTLSSFSLDIDDSLLTTIHHPLENTGEQDVVAIDDDSQLDRSIDDASSVNCGNLQKRCSVPSTASQSDTELPTIEFELDTPNLTTLVKSTTNQNDIDCSNESETFHHKDNSDHNTRSTAKSTDNVSIFFGKELRKKLRFPISLNFRSVMMLFIGSWIINSIVGSFRQSPRIIQSDIDLTAESVFRKILPPQFSLDNASVTLSSLLTTDEKVRPGQRLAEQGAQAHYPVVLIPGFITSGLEVWSGKECAKAYFRQRFWTSMTSARVFLSDTSCWNEHMKLDPFTGGDPDHGTIRLRAAEGFASADYFFANYWVFEKLIENLADVGYTPSLMSMEPYDWRLPFHLLEERDGYFTKLKSRIEALVKSSGKKVVLSSHSMGALVVQYFFAWIEDQKHNGTHNADWVNKNIHAYINIAGAHLGVPKAATALLSGEMKDTAFTGPMGNMVEQFFGRRMRRDLWATWGSLWTMLPKGGDNLWGQGSDICMSESSTSEDPFCPQSSSEYSPMILMTDSSSTALDDPLSFEIALPSPSTLSFTIQHFLSKAKLSITDIVQFLQTYGSGLGPDTIGAKVLSSSSSSRSSSKEKHRTEWHDPTQTPLPFAPDLKIYCLYGTGIPTERGFLYRTNWLDANNTDDGRRVLSDPPVILDTTTALPGIMNSIRYSDGDGSVPLLSLGYLCADAWIREDSGLNPAGVAVFTREYKNEQVFVVEDPMRGGPFSGEHVDILGNVNMTEDFLRVVTNFDAHKVNVNHIESDIVQIAKDVNKRGGVFKRRYLHRWENLLTHLTAMDHQIFV